MTNANLGLSEEKSNTVVNILQNLLADQHVLYMKLRNFHWNVTGPHFRALHLMFEEQYTALAMNIDEVAERIRTYDQLAVGSLAAMLDRARLSESQEDLSADVMVEKLVADNETLVRQLRADIAIVTDADDPGTADLLTRLIQEHQTAAWMLRSVIA
jgi:starvation-inducible DNA-binding protein